MNPKDTGIKFRLYVASFLLFNIASGEYYKVEFTRLPDTEKHQAKVWRDELLIYDKPRTGPFTRIKAVVLIEMLLSGQLPTIQKEETKTV